jgi:putative transposase
MPQPFQPRKRAPRLAGYDYSRNGAYFITICTQGRICYFGNIADGDMIPNAAGDMLMTGWDELLNKYPMLALDAFVVMPNHVHGVLLLHASPSAPSLSQIVQWFKTMMTNAYLRGVKEEGWQPYVGKLWQRSFYDHIIRNKQSLATIRKYIVNNPITWDEDQNNPAHPEIARV